MLILIDNEITVKQPTKKILNYCKYNLVLKNPEYARKERMGLWTGSTPKELYLYRIDCGNIILPVGAFRGILSALSKEERQCIRIINKIPYMDKINYGVTVQDFGLYDYQMEAVKDMYLNGFGILESKAGSGKTQMGIALIVKLRAKALWLTHTNDLLNQSYDRAAKYIDKKMLGKITGGKVEIGSGITFATVQTLSKQDLAQYKYTWDCIVVDEVHRCAGNPNSVTMFSKVVNSLAASHKYGLSATIHRADGLIKSTFALVGDVAYKVQDEAVANKVMQVIVKRIDTYMGMPEDALDTDGTIIYTKLINCIAEDVDRNKIIVDNIVECNRNYNLILSDRIAHLEMLRDMLPEDLKKVSAIINGKMTTKKGKAQREQAIDDMRTGKKRFLFASYKLAKEGLDIPRLDRLHMATPQKDYAVIVQSVGRIARVFPDKQTPVCYDYVDNIGMLENAYKSRVRHYKKCGCKGDWKR